MIGHIFGLSFYIFVNFHYLSFYFDCKTMVIRFREVTK
jgi:hypothetical protein